MSIIDLPLSAQSWGTDDFQKVLADELKSNASELSLEDAMDDMGMYKSDSVSVGIDSFEDTGSTITAKASVYFECEVQSSCADISFSSSYRAILNVVIDKGTAAAAIVIKGATEIDDERDEEMKHDLPKFRDGECPF